MPSGTEIAAHLDLSLTRVSILQNEGVLPKGESLDAIRVAYIRHLRKKKGGVTDERSRLDAAKADLAELELAERRGELVPAVDQDAALIALATAVQARILAVPAKTATQLAADTTPDGCEAIQRRALYAALHDLAEAGRHAAEKLD